MENGRVPYVHKNYPAPKNAPPVRLWTMAELVAIRFRCTRCGGALMKSAYVEDCAACVVCGESFHLAGGAR